MMDNTLNQVQDVLRSRFTKTSRNNEERFEGLLSYVADCPKGVETMTALADLDYRIVLDSLPFIKGMCTPDTKTLYLNSDFMVAMMAPTFVHEATHAMQLDRFPADIMQLNAADFIKASRAMEADANAHQAAFAYQARNKNTLAYTSEMESPSMKAYVAEMESSGDERKAMKKAFEAWYEDPKARGIYQENHTGTIKLHCQKAKNDEAVFKFGQSLTNDQLAKGLLFNGAPYMDSSFFASEKARAVPAVEKEKITAALTDLAAVKGGDVKKMIGPLQTVGETPPAAAVFKLKNKLAR